MSLSALSSFEFSIRTSLILDSFELFSAVFFVLVFFIFLDFKTGHITLWVKCKSVIKPPSSRSDEAPSGRELAKAGTALEVLLFFAVNGNFSSFFFFNVPFFSLGA